ncbi:hypothetical protein [Allosphingosinicella sp.]|jgi:hypothetical protein|uniref:hypothetical protein n=1 Tax=Allosphingosinicella sp. TaxID=2823234 RepID=UPI002EE58956
MQARVLLSTFAFAVMLVSTPALACDTGSVEVQKSGIWNGKWYNRIIVNFDRKWITYKYTDGTQWTEPYHTDEDFERAAEVTLEREVTVNC